MKIHIKKSKNKKFYFNVVARNGRTLATSEMYNYKQGCLKSAKLFKLKIKE